MNKIFSDMRAQTTPSDATVAELKERPVQKKRPAFRLKHLVAGACSIAVVCLCVLAIPGLELGQSRPIEPGTTNNELAYIKKWEERTLFEKYTTLEHLGKEYIIGGECELALGELISDGDMVGYDYYSDRRHTLPAEIYSIVGVDPAAAVAAIPEGEDIAVLYATHDYSPRTLGELIDGLDLKNNLRFGKVYRSYFEDGKYISEVYTLELDDAVWTMLLADRSLINEGSDHYGLTLMGISIDVASTGQKNISLGINSEGYIQTNILGHAKSYNVGLEAVNDFYVYVIQNGSVERTVHDTSLPDAPVVTGGEELVIGTTSGGYSGN